MLHARQLLEDTQLAVEEVAEGSGFGSAALLRHHFNKIVGVSPKDYRRTFGGARSSGLGEWTSRRLGQNPSLVGHSLARARVEVCSGNLAARLPGLRYT